MKLKYYLRGVGIGLIIATLILMISTALHSNKDISDEEIIARAEQLGMVMKTDAANEETKTLADLDDSTKEETDEKLLNEDGNNNTTDEQSDRNQETAADTENSFEESQQSTENEEQKLTDDEKPQVDVVEKVEVTIVPGEYSDKVSTKLQKAGLIDDAESFNKYLAEKKYDNLIQPGNYQIPTDSDYDAIIKIITEKKKKS